jgi:hypothetical protein
MIENNDPGIGDGAIMATWRRMFLVAHVWLTAFMMLFAGLPYVRCQCLADFAKPIFPSAPFQVSNCCGAGSSCTPSPQGTDRSGDTSRTSQVKMACCCCHAASAQSTDKDKHAQLKNLGCKRTLTDADPALPSSQERVNDSMAVELLLSDIAPASLDLSAEAGCFLLAWQNHSEPPPTDLVLTLQHFVI